jgi:hypothetical protein
MNGKRMILILMLTLMIAVAARTTAQQKKAATATGTAMTSTTTTTTTGTAAPADQSPTSQEIRSDLAALLHDHPPELGTILALDPTLLSDDAFLAHYPDLARFVAAHPDVRRQTAFYVEAFQPPKQNTQSIDRVLEPLFAVGAMLLFLFAMAWVIRTLVEQNRWSRLARSQSEVHNKILDRFGTSTELLDYIKTPAGARFLESAPIPLHGEPARMSAPVARILGSVQFGVIISAAAAGVLFVSTRFTKEAGDGLFAIGTIALCIGAGFIVSAIVSLMLSRRLGKANDERDLAVANQ